MPRRSSDGSAPSWDRLYGFAREQGGFFTTAQAAEAGYSTPLLQYHLARGRIERMQRGIYRLVHHPLGEHDDLVVAWLWSSREGVFSHYTALALHELSDVLPAKKHLTLPPAWRGRRLRVPPGLVLHHAEITPEEIAWHGCLPVTSPLRTLTDCLASHLSWDLLQQAARQGIERGDFTTGEVQELLAGTPILEEVVGQ